MNRTAWFLIGMAAGSLCGAERPKPTPNAPPVLGVTLENTSYSAANHSIDYDLVNGTQKYATAWVLVESFKGAGGTDSIGSWSITETAGSLGRAAMLAPGARKHAQYAAQAKDGPEARLAIAAAIYDDASAEGDEAFLAYLFAARKARSDEQQRWLTRLAGLKTAGNPAAEAQQLYQDMVEAAYQEDKAAVAAELTPDQREGRRERQSLEEAVRAIVQASEAKRPVEQLIRRMEAQAEALLQGSLRKF